jgi:hypothetical protein
LHVVIQARDSGCELSAKALYDEKKEEDMLNGYVGKS